MSIKQRYNLLNQKYKCTICGKTVFSFNMSYDMEIAHQMHKEHICWECAYWRDLMQSPPDNLEIIGDNCYQTYPFIPKQERDVSQILGYEGKKTFYILKRTGECYRTNDIWWLNTIPPKYRLQLIPTAWLVTKRFWQSMERSKHKCKAVGCMDRYHCYRYQYQLEIGKEPYNYVPKDWVVGDEHCPAFLDLRDIQHYDEHIKPTDIIDENSVQL